MLWKLGDEMEMEVIDETRSSACIQLFLLPLIAINTHEYSTCPYFP